MRFFFNEIVFGGTADRAYPIMRHIVPGCSWSYAVIWISFNRIINITANCTGPFIHLFSPFSVGERLFLAQILIYAQCY